MTKETRLWIRVSEENKALIKKAAEKKSVSISNYTLDATTKKAKRDLK